MALCETQRFYRMAYERMHPEDKVAYRQLHDAHQHDGSGPLLGVQMPNSFLVFELQGIVGVAKARRRECRLIDCWFVRCLQGREQDES